MKTQTYLILLLTLLALGAFALAVKAQSTNAAPAGITVTQPSAVTTTAYTSAQIVANPAQTAMLTAAYMTPLLTSTGVTLPRGSTIKTVIVVYYADGSSKTMVVPCAASALPAPPVITSSNAGSSTNSH